MRSRLLWLGLALLVAAQLLCSGPLSRSRRHLQPPGDEAFTAVTPGEFAGTLMLGGFRGLACDMLWIRAESAQEQGRYYESLALYDTISRIQPRFEQIWSYLSWNMAYNLGHEVEDEDSKWTWMLDGITTNVRGCERNPQSERLLRHLAWMFQHRGDLFHARVQALDWSPLLGPLIQQVNRQLPADRRVPNLPRGAGASNFRISATLYRACVAMADVQNRDQSAFVPRMIPLAIESDGDLARNRGDHLSALRIWMEALHEWRVVAPRYLVPATTAGDEMRRRFGLDSCERNEGRLRRKAAEMARQLAPTPSEGEQTARWIMQREDERITSELSDPSKAWKHQAHIGGIHWLDER